MTDLRAIIRIKTMAQAAARIAEQPGPYEGEEMATAYGRLRRDARGLSERAGWGSGDDFDAELPPLPDPSPPAHWGMDTEGWMDGLWVEAGQRARVLLRQLAAWAAGHQEAFEVEEQLKANAATRAAASRRRPAGFGQQ